MKILVLNGPNLNMLGRREPQIYGDRSLDDLLAGLRSAFQDRVEISALQFNSEGALIDALQTAWHEGVDGVVFNAGAYTHTSVALHDAIKSIAPIPVIEVHMSNVHARETFRHTSVIAAACRGVIAGFGFDSYRLAIEAVLSCKADIPQ
ncbi:type II 3-dehydroquinate dehydratase [Alloprevotella sp. OH1205_COT-284]|uniref:type II 3-dehydroquinate dehydratase n=1 Tax=Alloprevotella sp. OH1205_COT-284 TaxID=2491043 RepID=UPI000F5D6370|nr:type II 3-dehydroquinate dehydratase [Alloprevotella sp. OH1205_COT-284]RRD80836.1 type II 3-dehydroquinate dehydratase [Alloprevotella sp. OH1205_COT-284]